MSHSWRSILIGREILLENLGWALGDEKSIKLWQDLWLNLSRQERPMGTPTVQSVDSLVADLLSEYGKNWDRSKIQRLLPEYEEKILCLTPSVTGAPDKLIWLGSRSGEYSVKSGYFIAMECDDGPVIAETEFNWSKQVWSLDCAPKVKLFCWKVLKGAVPVGERLVERHINADPKCKRCGENESILHLLFHCHFAQQIWRLAPFVREMDNRGTIYLRVAWPVLVKKQCLPTAGISSGGLFPWLLWVIWKARNRFVFEGFTATPEDTLSSAIKLAREWSEHSKPKASVVEKRRMIVEEVPAGTITVQSDAAWNPVARIAGIGWTNLLQPQCSSFQQQMEYVASPLMAEALALREAVLSCRRLEMQRVKFESDSAQLIKCLSSGDPVVEIHSVVLDIIELSSVFEFVSFVWIPRGKNALADCLAKGALNVIEPWVGVEAFDAPN